MNGCNGSYLKLTKIQLHARLDVLLPLAGTSPCVDVQISKIRRELNGRP